MLASPWVAAPLSLLFWVSCVLIIILWTPVVAIYRLFTQRRDPDRYRVGRVVHDMAVLAVRLNPFWKFRVIEKFRPDPRRPYVFVANHASNADAFLIAMLPWEMKWLSKKAIFDIPLLGWELRVAGDVPVLRGDKESARRAMEALRERLDRRLSIIVFPQGTRSEGGTVGSFREGAFRLAIEAQADVIPLAVSGTEKAVPKGSLILQPVEASVTVLPPVSVAGLTVADAPRLAETVRHRIAEELGQAAAPVQPRLARSSS